MRTYFYKTNCTSDYGERGARAAVSTLDRDAWAQVLACIGEQFTDGDEVNGIAVVIRSRGDRIELWSRTASNEAAQVRGKAVQLPHPSKQVGLLGTTGLAPCLCNVGSQGDGLLGRVFRSNLVFLN